uniref:Ubiquitin-like protease family profile domain-containing protein n=1 Tax=Brassica oleracea var. oleracea TaxID=109376 RepID=A0A0D3B8F6_BRAOL
MEPFLYMVPYLLVECASSDEQRAQYSLEPFTYERLTNIPQARAGDCGVYALKYIEWHALGMPFSKKDFAKPNGKTMSDKMAVDIFKELPDAHEFENKDNDANLERMRGDKQATRLTVKSSGMLDDLTISSLESLLCSDLL